MLAATLMAIFATSKSKSLGYMKGKSSSILRATYSPAAKRQHGARPSLEVARDQTGTEEVDNDAQLGLHAISLATSQERTGNSIIMHLSYSLSSLLERVQLWTRKHILSLANAIVKSAIEVSRKSRNTAAAAASATHAIWEDTRTLVQKRAANAFASSVEKRLDYVIEMVGDQVKQRMKDKDMPEFILDSIDETVETIIPDIKDEFYRKTIEVRDAYLSPALSVRRRRAMRDSRRSYLVKDRATTPQDAKNRSALTEKSDTTRSPIIVSESGLDTPMGSLNGSQTRRALTFSGEGKKSIGYLKDIAAGSAKGKDFRANASTLILYRFERNRRACIRSYICFCCNSKSKLTRALCRFVGQGRAWILYTLSPYDRSIWWSIKNPRWWALTGLGMVPYVGQLFWLLVFFLKNKKDEYQLIDFITGFQMARFSSQGCGFLLYGCAKYYLCVGRLLENGIDACQSGGPSLSVYGVCFFTLQIGIVWIAFFMLPWSNRPELTPDVRQAHTRFGAKICVDIPSKQGESNKDLETDKLSHFRGYGFTGAAFAAGQKSVDKVEEHSHNSHGSQSGTGSYGKEDGSIIYIYDEDGKIVPDEQDLHIWPWISRSTVRKTESEDERIDIVSREMLGRRGGQLTKMFWYTSTAVVIAIVAVIASLISASGWRLHQTLFWIRTVYCLTLFPFVIFKLPMMNSLLTHSHKTGYDAQGRTCIQKANIGKKSGSKRNRAYVVRKWLDPTNHRASQKKKPLSRVSTKRSKHRRFDLKPLSNVLDG